MAENKFRVATSKVTTEDKVNPQANAQKGADIDIDGAAEGTTQSETDEESGHLRIDLVAKEASFAFDITPEFVDDDEPIVHMNNNNVYLRFAYGVNDEGLRFIANHLSNKIPGLFAGIFTGDRHAVHLSMHNLAANMRVEMPLIGRYHLHATWYEGKANLEMGTLKRYRVEPDDREIRHYFVGAGSGMNGATVGTENGGDPPRG